MSPQSQTHWYARLFSFPKRNALANAEKGMTSLPANDATKHSFLTGKRGRVHDSVTCQQRKEGMVYLPGHDFATRRWRKGGMIFIASNVRLGARYYLRNALVRKPSRFVSSLECWPRSLETLRKGPELCKLTSLKVSKVLLRSSTQPVAIWRLFSSQASTCFGLTT